MNVARDVTREANPGVNPTRTVPMELRAKRVGATPFEHYSMLQYA